MVRLVEADSDGGWKAQQANVTLPIKPVGRHAMWG